MDKPIAQKICQLEKIPGKGGWIYCRIPEILPSKKNPFGWVCVKGTIDTYSIKSYHLMPFGNGELFLPIKAEIRKTLKKKVGDYVEICLYKDDDPLVIPEELILCLQDDPEIYNTFIKMEDYQKRTIIKKIYSAKRLETRVNRIASLMTEIKNVIR